MKKILALAALLLFLATPVMAEEAKECTQWCKPYWKSMPKEEYVYFVAQGLDMLTTLDIKNHPELKEGNPFLGEHPSDGKIIAFMVGGALLHSAITYAMVDGDVPTPIIKTWEYISIGWELGFAAHNYSMGLRFSF